MICSTKVHFPLMPQIEDAGFLLIGRLLSVCLRHLRVFKSARSAGTALIRSHPAFDLRGQNKNQFFWLIKK